VPLRHLHEHPPRDQASRVYRLIAAASDRFGVGC